MAFSWAAIVTFFAKHPFLSEIALSAGSELFFLGFPPEGNKRLILQMIRATLWNSILRYKQRMRN